MCDSPVESSSCLSDSHSNSKCSYSSANYCNSAHDLRGDFLLLEAGTPESCNRNGAASPYRFQLERDVQKLQQQLQEEMELHASLEGAIARNAERLSSPSYLPHHTQEIVSNIALLEDTISELEQELVSLHFQLSQERNERRLAEYRLKHSSIQSSLRCSKHSIRGHGLSSKEIFPEELKEVIEPSTDPSCTNSFGESVVVSGLHLQRGSLAEKMDTGSCPPTKYAKPTKGMPSRGLWEHPNKLSEEMVRCMKNIFICLADSALPAKSSISDSHRSSASPRGHLSTSSLWSLSERSMISSWVQSPQIDMSSNLDVFASENAFDPYRVRGKLSWVEIGNYGFATEVSWMSVGKRQLEYAAGALRGFRTLVEQLAKVNPIHLSGDEKLAFWINLYNALLMHAYLAYGVPRSELKLFSLMQKAAYTVGGHSFSAAAIEYAILKMKPPVHRPQISLLLALHKLKVSEEQRKFATDTFEPLVNFALSCGSYSSPAVRIYTAENVREELQGAQRDFIRASVGLSGKGKLLVPKMLHCFARGIVDDANLAVWISHYLPPHQAGFVEHCMSQRRQSLLGSRNCGILPFDSRFRYLFLPDKIPL